MSAVSALLSTRIRRRGEFGEVSCTECAGQQTDFELIPTVEMEARNPVEGYFGSEFPVICNHCGVMVEKRPLTVKFSKFCSEIFHCDTDVLCSNFVKFGRLEIVKSCLAYLTKKFRLALQLLLLHRSRPKSARTSPQQCTQSTQDFIQIGSLSAEL